jgi:hypothetical protein
MNYTIFILSLIGLCISSLVTFITAYRKRPLPLLIFVPLIALCGSSLYTSYHAILGYPVQMEWNQLPNKITVVYFRVTGETLSLWLLDGDTTRLVHLPFSKSTQETMEAQRSVMGRGTPVTFKKTRNGTGADGKADEDDDEGDPNNKKGKHGKRGGKGWRYKVDSYGDPIRGSLPPKF